MALLLITFDLHKPKQGHGELIEQIKKYSYVRLSDTSYAIITDKTPMNVCDGLKKIIQKEDSLYVITLKHPYDGCGPNLANDWLMKSLTY